MSNRSLNTEITQEWLRNNRLEKIGDRLQNNDIETIGDLCGLTEGDMDKLDFSVGIKVRIRDIQAAMRQPLPGSPNPSTPDHNTATGPSNTAIVTSNTAIVTSNDGSSAVQPPSEPNLVRSAPPLDPATQSGSPSPPAAQSSSTPPTAQSGPAPPVAQSGESAPEHNVVQAYIPLNIVSNWQCALGHKHHHVFISYRVVTEKDAVVNLYATLITKKTTDTYDRRVYLDQMCLATSMPFEEGFYNGILNSQVIVIILSEKGLERAKNAHRWPDNQLLEIEVALQQMESSKGSSSPVVVLPVFMNSKSYIDGKDYYSAWVPNCDDYPDEVHCHPSSPSRLSSVPPRSTIRNVLKKLLKLQGLFATNSYALAKLAPEIFQLISRTQIAAAPESNYDVKESIVLDAEDVTKLHTLLNPINSDSDRKAMQDLYVEGTRQWLFKEVTDWASSNTSDTVLWINADAGAGKSVAAAQIANMLLSTDQLVSALFLKYNEAQKNNPRDIITTIAFGLCCWYAPIGRKLIEAKLSRENLEKMPISDLFATIIESPITALEQYHPKGAAVIVVDGLDECFPRDEMLTLLTQRLPLLSKNLKVKLLLTSRPERDITEAFQSLATKTIKPSSEENIADLELYIRHRLKNETSLNEADCTEAVTILLSQSKTFVWIDLILKSLKRGTNDQRTTLQRIKSISSGSNDVGQLYQKTFSMLYNHCRDKEDLITVISAIATAQSIQTPRTLAQIFFIGRESVYALMTVRHCLKNLEMVLDRVANGSTDDGEVKFNHKSVADYLLGEESKDEPWHVPKEFHVKFAKGCLGVILSHEPAVNICEIYDVQTMIHDFDSKVRLKISPSLRYSVAHWITHFVWCLKGVAESSPVWQSPELVEATTVFARFVKTHVFFWLECGSLTYAIKPIIEQLAVLRGVIAKAPSTIVDDTTKELVKDTYRFIREFADPIIKSAPQVYNSGYAFTPKETAIYKTYADRLEDKIPFLVTAGPGSTWDLCEATLSGHTDVVCSVAVSSDSKTIVSGSLDQYIKLWDSTTRQLKRSIGPLPCKIKVVALSSATQRIAVGSVDQVLRIIDVVTGTVLHRLDHHEDEITSLAFSSDGKTLVSGSEDWTIKVWDVAQGTLQQTLCGHDRDVRSVALSKDGLTIVTGSIDKTIRIWKETGACRKTINVKERVYTIALTSNDTRIVSGNKKGLIQVWNLESGEQIQSFNQGSPVRSVAVTTDETLLVAGSDDGEIKVWGLADGTLKGVFSGHTRQIGSVTISPDSMTVVSGSVDMTVRLWDLSSVAAQNTLEATSEKHTGMIAAVTFSEDGRLVATGSKDCTAKIWNALTGRLVRTLSQHTAEVLAVKFSSDGNQLVTGSTDTTAIVWDVATGNAIRTLAGSKYGVCAIDISPKLIATGGWDGWIRVWDRVTGQEAALFEAHWSGVLMVRIGEDESTIESSDGSSDISSWLLERGTAKPLAKNMRILEQCQSLDRWELKQDAAGDQWIKHWEHRTKVPYSLFSTEPRVLNSQNALCMARYTFTIICPIHSRNEYGALWLEEYRAAKRGYHSSTSLSRLLD